MTAAPARLSLPRKLVFGLLFAAVLLGAAEGITRAILGPPPPPVRVFSALGDHDRYLEEESDGVHKRYLPNDLETEKPFAPHVEGQRIAVMGESSVHLGTANLINAQEFPALLGAALHVASENLGGPGLDSFDHVQIAREALAFDFSVLVIYTGHNDLGNTWFQARYGTAEAGAEARLRARLSRLTIFSSLTRLVRKPDGTERLPGLSLDTPRADISQFQRDEAARNFEANLRRVVWMAHNKKVAVVLATPASRLDIPPLLSRCDEHGRCANDIWQAGIALNGTNPAGARKLLEEARDLDGIPLRASSDITEAVRRVAADEHTWLVDIERTLPMDPKLNTPNADLFVDFLHLSEAGHQTYAAMLAPAVKEALEAQARFR